MLKLERLLDFYIFSNIHVAFATFCFTKITLSSYLIQQNDIAWFVFFSTVLSYNYIRLYRRSEIKTDWFALWITKHRNILILVCLVSLAGLIFYGLRLTQNALLALIPFGLATLFYVLPFSRGKSLRAVSTLKLFLIAFCWAGVTVLLPLIQNNATIDVNVFITFLQRFLFVVAITIPFDIRDLSFDTDSLMTLPQMIGLDNSKRLGLLFLMLFLGLNFLKSDIDISILRTELIVALLALILLVRAKEHQHKYYSALFVESIPIVWYLLILIQ